LTRKQGQGLLDIYTARKEEKGGYQNGEDEDEEDEDKTVSFLNLSSIHS
jgi:hypothetical protein